jgi:hypothetical protein
MCCENEFAITMRILAQFFPGHGAMKPEQQEIERLRRELTRMKTERDSTEVGGNGTVDVPSRYYVRMAEALDASSQKLDPASSHAHRGRGGVEGAGGAQA